MKQFKLSIKTRIRNTFRMQPRVLLFTLWRSGTHWMGSMLSEMMEIPGIIDSTDDQRYKEETIESLMNFKRNTFLIRHISHAPDEMLKLIQDLGLHVIVLIRDPRDVILSNINMRKYHEGYRPGLPPFPDMSFDDILEWELNTHTEAYTQRIPAWATLNHPRVMCVRYEDLSADTLSELRRIRNFLGLPVRDERLAEIALNNSFERVTQRTKGQEVKNSHNRKGIVGDYKNAFSPAQQQHLNAVLRDALLNMGYSVGSTPE